MFQRCQNLRTISNLSVVQKIRYDFNCRFSSKSEDNDPPKENPVSKMLDDAVTFADAGTEQWATSPYPATAAESAMYEKPKKPSINPSERSIILFPGQGIIKVGDVKEYLRFPRVKELFNIANDILGYDLFKMCLKGPQSLLDRTEFNQPATVVLSLAAIEKLQEERPKALETCMAVAGYSVGELTALIFSGAMAYEEGLKLVAVRAAAMQNASELSAQGMLSCYCTPEAKSTKICEDAKKWAMDIGATDPVCSVAIYLYTQGKVFGGSKEALEYIEKNGRQLGLRKIQKLAVSGAFHTNLMQPALKSFMKGLNNTPLDEPNVNVYSNFSANIYNGNDKLSRKYLIKQITSPVKWEQIMQKLYERPEGTPFPRTFDVGSRGTMKTILRMINAKAAVNSFTY